MTSTNGSNGVHPADMSTADLERELVRLAFDREHGGRWVESRSSALRLALRIRQERGVSPDVEAKIARAVAAVNRVRPADRQITESDMTVPDAECIALEASWADLFATTAELEEYHRRRRARTWCPSAPDGGPEEPHGPGCEVCAERRPQRRAGGYQ